MNMRSWVLYVGECEPAGGKIFGIRIFGMAEFWHGRIFGMVDFWHGTIQKEFLAWWNFGIEDFWHGRLRGFLAW